VKRFFAIIATVVALLLVMQAGGGWRALHDAVSDWLDGRDARARAEARANALASANARDVGAGFGVQPRAPGAALAIGAQGGAQTNVAALNNDPNAQLALWQERYERAKEIYDNYRKQTVYPFDSRPAREHPDQMYPNQPIVEDRKLKKPGEKASQNIRLKTSQERIHVAGEETVLFTVAAFDENNAAAPISFTRSIVYDPPRDGKPPKRNPAPFVINDLGENGDLSKDDLTYSARLSPIDQGYANHSGLIRIEMNLTVAEQSGFLYFDIYYSPEPPAVWAGKVREALERGSLNFYLPIDVRREGRFVVTGRIDDAKGQPFALVTFNDELGKGAKEIKLNLFGKLLVDEAPAFPLTLRDIDGFLLIPDADPDRALMQRLQGKQHVTRSYALTSFSEAEWDSEERRRYLEEYGKDVESARAHLEHIRRSMKP
jgi:hypothetical protein